MSDIDSSLNTTMAAESKEISPEQLEANEKQQKSSSSAGTIEILLKIAKKAAIVGTIYLVGYMNWSIAWFICPVILSAMRDQWKIQSEMKRSIAKASALYNEKDMILAKIDDLPAWVFFPDVERCEWMNKILKQIWPNANHYAKSILKETIEPNVRKALAGYKLNGFEFDRMILGTIPPRIGGIKVYEKNIARNEIILDMDIFYAGDCDINFSIGAMRAGIKDFQIHGMMRVVMKPLINHMPLIGGLQVFFLNNPSIDFNLVGIADLMDFPGLSDLMRRIIVEQVAAIMVLPNKLPFILNDIVPAFKLKMPEPEGVLRIHVVEAKDLMKKDINLIGKGKSDPYCIITVGAQQFRTQTITNNVNPKWDYWCEANVYAESGQTVTLELFDKDDTGSDEKLGRATIEIKTVTKKGELDTWLTLEDAKHGMIHLRLTWLTLSSMKSDLKAALEETQVLRVSSNLCTGVLTVFLDSAKNLPMARTASNPDPYVILTVGKKTEQTNPQMRTDSPVFEQGFTFLVPNPENDSLSVKIMDQKTGNELGKLNFLLSILLEKSNMETIQSQPFALQKSGAESKVFMSLSLRVLKKAVELEELQDTRSAGDVSSPIVQSKESLSRTSSIKTVQSIDQLKKQDSKISSSSSIVAQTSVQEEPFEISTVNSSLSMPPPSSPTLGNLLIHRTPSQTSSAGQFSLGRIQLTLRYSIQRQRLIVIVHKIAHIPLKDPSNIPDPYVKLYLLPGRSKDSKRKTNTVKDNCNPVFDATFEYVISTAELNNSELEITVCTQKGFLSGGSPIIGMVKLLLNDAEISQQGKSSWFDLLPENKYE